MKATKATLDQMRELLAPLDTAEHRALYRAGQIPRADTVQDLDVRYRWDLCWAAKLHRELDLYGQGLNDSHIDTALRALVPPLFTSEQGG